MKERNSEKWLVELRDKDYLESVEAEKLVYLSGDAEEEMESFDKEKIYIIGGLVDHNSLKNITLNKSRERKIKSLKFPIKKYMKVVGS